MAFGVNSFAVLDVVGDDDLELPVPAAASYPKRLQSPAAPVASKEESSSLQPPLPQSQYGRGRGARGRQQNGSLEIHGGRNSQDQINAYRRFDGKVYQQRGGSNGYRRYNGHNECYRQHDGIANGYQQHNSGNSGYRKKSIHDQEQNNADSIKPYRRDSSSTEDNGSEQVERRMIGGGGRRNFNEDNKYESKRLEGDSGASPVKSPGDKFYRGDANQAKDCRFNSRWERRSNRGGNSVNWNHESRSFVKHGNGEVKTSSGMETPGDNEVPVSNSEDSANTDGKERVDAFKEAEANGNGKEVPAGNDSKEGSGKEIPSGNDCKEQMEEQKMTLQEYEKQLLEKRKALEALKKEERKVTLDKDFESMQLLGRKKEDFFLNNLNSEKEKLKKEDILEKDEKLRKSMSIEEFQSKYGSRGNARRHGHGGRGGGQPGGGFGRGLSRAAREDEAPNIKDSCQFPGLGVSQKVA